MLACSSFRYLQIVLIHSYIDGIWIGSTNKRLVEAIILMLNVKFLTIVRFIFCLASGVTYMLDFSGIESSTCVIRIHMDQKMHCVCINM